MAHVGATYKKEFVQEFKEACTKLGISQSKVFKSAMQKVIDKTKPTERSVSDLLKRKFYFPELPNFPFPLSDFIACNSSNSISSL